jgi:hypothetical protein
MPASVLSPPAGAGRLAIAAAREPLAAGRLGVKALVVGTSTEVFPRVEGTRHSG